jgi:glucose-1-phosphate thymidylyltransferase
VCPAGDSVKAYILAAGYATRMYPLTRDQPKALLEVAGRPIITHIVERMLALDDLTEIVVVTNARFLSQFERWRAHQTTAIPITVLNDGTTSNDTRLGAIADLKFAIDTVPLDGEHALVVAGDTLFECDLRPVQRAFLARGAPTLIVRRAPELTSLSKYNEVSVTDDGRVTRFIEKPPRSETNLTAIALYFFPAATLLRLAEYLGAGGNPDAPGHFIAWLVEREPCYAESLVDRWFDIGSIESLEQARAAFSA